MPKLSDLALIAELLPRAAIGASLASYASLGARPGGALWRLRTPADPVIILDNGRNRILASPY